MTSTERAPDRVLGTGQAYGKVVLLGEHTVVYGMPAIAIPAPGLMVNAELHVPSGPVAAAAPSVRGSTSAETVEMRFVCSADTFPADSGAAAATAAALRTWDQHSGHLEVHIRSDIPSARGLGSSAAAAAAAVRAVADHCGTHMDERSLYSLVQVGEQIAHGHASGVDAAAVTAQGPIGFAAGIARPLRSAVSAVLVVADSGVAGSTRAAVDAVRAVLRHDRANARRILRRAGRIAETAENDLAAGDAVALGTRLSEFHSLLRELDVSTPELERLIATALRAGALGAKLTGGGLGGCLVALTDTHRTETVRKALSAAGAARTWTVPIAQDR